MSAFSSFCYNERWVAWRNEPRGSKMTKVPYCPLNGAPAKANDPSTWGDRPRAEILARRIVNGGGGGVGIQLGDLGEGTTLIGIDLDSCIDAKGDIAGWAKTVIERVDSYTEISPSGTGVKIFALFATDMMDQVRPALGDARYSRLFSKHGAGRDHPPAIELHLGNRYFAVTEQHVGWTPEELTVVDVSVLLWILTEYGPAFAGVPVSNDDEPEAGVRDNSRSAAAFRLGAKIKRAGGTFEEMREALRTSPDTATWYREQGNSLRQVRRIWDRTGMRDANNQDIEDLNTQYAVVNEGGHVLIFEQRYDPLLKRYVLDRMSFQDFSRLLMNRTVDVVVKDKAKAVKLADYWLSHPDRRQYVSGVTFDPTSRAPADYWNLWRGLQVEPRAGDWGLMQEHVRDVICAGNKRHYEYLLNLAARMYQQPQLQGEVAVVLRGLKGCGKGVFLHALLQPWGQHGIYISNSSHLVGRFNEHLRDCIMLYADEAFFAGDKAHESVLKSLITEASLPIEGKYKTLVTVRNMLHLWISSNEEWVVPVSQDERRYYVLNVLGHRVGDRGYFNALAAQMQNGGLSAMVHDLLARDISGFDHRDVPRTSALTGQQELSQDSLDQWWDEVLDRGFVWDSPHGIETFGEWHEFVTTHLLEASYQQWCRRHSVRRPLQRVVLGRRFTAIYGQHTRKRGQIIGEVERPLPHWTEHEMIRKSGPPMPGYVLGLIGSARDRFVKARIISPEADVC